MAKKNKKKPKKKANLLHFGVQLHSTGNGAHRNKKKYNRKSKHKGRDQYV